MSQLAVIAAAVLAVAGVSRLLTGTPVTTAMAFVVIGVLLGPLVIDEITLAPTSSAVRTLAEATLAIVLFADASRIKIRRLRDEYSVPLRLLGIGLPLTIGAGTLAALAIFGQLNLPEALVLGVVLAPTDAALGQSVVTEPRLPSRIRQGLNVESGLNDGICVPLLLIALALADVEDKTAAAPHAFRIVAEEIGYGVAGGLVAGLASAAIVAGARRRGLISGSWLQVIPLAAAALAYATAAALGGSGFIAAFLAGVIFGSLVTEAEATSRLNEEIGGLLGGVTFLVFGALLLGPSLEHVSWHFVLYAVLSLTALRMLPVALAMLGSGARGVTVAFLGWFGPRGLASTVFAVIAVEEAQLSGAKTILLAGYLTVGLSVIAHGVTAAPLARRYAGWCEAKQRMPPPMESLPTFAHRTRSPVPGPRAEPRSGGG